MENHEDLSEALTAYARNQPQEIPPILEQYLNEVAKNGETRFQWPLLKPLIVGKMEQVIEDLRKGLSTENIPTRPNVENVRFEVMHARIMEAVNKFNGAPFTIQRLCELLIDPKRHYKRSDKFMRGLEKNVLVVSTVDPFGRKVVSESASKHLVNGMDTNGSPFFPRDSNITMNLPPVPGWVTSTVALATRPQNTPAVDSNAENRQTQQTSQDSTLSSNGLASSVYADQGEQPQGVHGEEVVEETVVTMDTSHVATDGGEALAEDEEEEIAGGEDTNASTSSSSSSSSEELATSSDTSEGSGNSATVTAVSSSETDTRPWASIANEGENKKVKKSLSTEAESSGKSSAELPSSQSPDTSGSSSPETTKSPAGSNQTESTVSEKTPSQSDKSENSSTEKETMDDSFGFETASPLGTTTQDSSKEQQRQRSESQDSNISMTSDAESEDSATGSDEVSPASENTGTNQTQPEYSRTYAEVVASSSTDSSVSRNLPPMDPTLECDSVAGLERLVDSVEPCPNPSISSSSSSLPALSQSSPPIASQTSQPCESTSLSSSSVDPDEPQAKRCRLSDDVSSVSQPATSHPATATSPPSSEAETEQPSSNSADTTDTDISVPTEQQKQARSESESSDSVSCSMEEEPSDSSSSSSTTATAANPSSVELGGGDCITQESVKSPSSPPSQLSSSSDSQGFDVCGDSLAKNSGEEKQGMEQETGESAAASEAESDSTHEPMEH